MKAPDSAGLGQKQSSSAGPDASLAGDVRRKKAKETHRPAVSYDAFRYKLELQVSSKRHEQMETLRKIIDLGSSDREMPGLIFQYAELAWEESRALFFEANRKDDDFIRAKNQGDQPGMQRALAAKGALLEKSQAFQGDAVERYKEIVHRYPHYARMDEVLYFLGHNLWDESRESEALGVYRLLVNRFPKSKYVPDAYLAFGEFYFDSSKGQREPLVKALAAYKKAASYPENKAYLYAIYKQGWCYYNLADYRNALDLFKTVILYADLASSVNQGSKLKLAKDARKDYVLAYSHLGDPGGAKADFQKAGGPDNWWSMLEGLAGLYYDDGNDKAAVLVYRKLFRERPLSAEAPFFQARIVAATMRVGDKRQTSEQAELLVKVLSDVEKAGTAKTPADTKALAKAQDLAERTLSNLAVTWHNEGKKTRDDETLALADRIYRDYLALFPESPKAYSLHFFHGELLYDQLQRYGDAAKEYDWVVAQDEKRLAKHEKPGRWRQKAAEDAVFAWEAWARADGTVAAPGSTTKGTQPLPIPPKQQGLLDACMRYLRLFPGGAKVVEVEYKAAQIDYRYNRFKAAVKLFSAVALEHPAGDLAVYSANLVLDSFNLLADYGNVHDWARRFLGIPALAKGKFHDDLLEVFEESGFKLVEIQERQGHFEEAARRYLGFVADFPRGRRADQALWNASVDFYKDGSLARSIQIREELIAHYPESALVAKALLVNAEAWADTADFALAAAAFERYAASYERQAKGGVHGDHATRASDHAGSRFSEAKAQTALINAAVFRMGLRQYGAALKDRESYLRIWPAGRHGSQQSEKVFASVADVFEAEGRVGEAVKQLEAYAQRLGRDPDQLLRVDARLEKLYVKAHNPRAAHRIDQEILALYRHSSHRQLSPEAYDAVGQASYALNQEAFDAFERQRLQLPEKRLLEEVKAKGKALTDLVKAYTETVGFHSAEPAICALWRIGLAYKSFAQALYDAPVPAQFRGSEQLVQAYKDQLSERALPVEAKAKEAFASAVTKSRELGLYDHCAEEALDGLRKYDPASYGEVPEAVAAVSVQLAPSIEGMVAVVEPVSPAGSSPVGAPISPGRSTPAAAASQQVREAPVMPRTPISPAAPPSGDEEPTF